VIDGVTYDSGALIAAEWNDRRMWAIHAGLLAEAVVPVVPAPVLAEAWRGGARQARLARLLAPCDVEVMSEQIAKDVGVLAGRAHHDDVVDVAVVEGALRRGHGVVTSNRSHIAAIANAVGRELRIDDI
jgi:predicted nucleic acid-binding protein